MPEATFIFIFTTSFLVALTGAMMPGPLLVLTIGEAAQRGFWAGPLLILGHSLLELSLVIALILGLSQLIGVGRVSSIIGMAGGLVLIVMGLATMTRGWHKATIPKASSAGIGHNRMLVLSGVLGSISNPYWFLWWATIGLTYLLWSLKLGAIGVASFFTSHILADFSWYALIAFIIATGKTILSDAVYRWLLLICGLALVVLGGYFIISGVKFLTA